MIWLRLKELRNTCGLSQQAFAEKLGLMQPTYSKYEIGKAAIPDELKQQLASMGVNMNWLITGQGPMYLDGADTGGTAIVPSAGTFITPKGRTVAVEIGDGMLSVPIIAQRVSAGPGQQWGDDDMSDERIPVLERLIRRYPPEKVFATEVRGDSMKGDTLDDADIAIFVMGEVDGDNIYVLSVDGEVLIKHVEFDPFDKKLTIRSSNPLYQPKVVDPERVTLLGKVVAWFHVPR